jgi:hypothetical protein
MERGLLVALPKYTEDDLKNLIEVVLRLSVSCNRKYYRKKLMKNVYKGKIRLVIKGAQKAIEIGKPQEIYEVARIVSYVMGCSVDELPLYINYTFSEDFFTRKVVILLCKIL